MNSGRIMRLTAEHVKLCHREVADAGPLASVEPMTDADFRPAAERLLTGRTDKPVWLFAYGSLIWKPEVPHEDMKRATAQGWHRAFSMQIRRYRATVEQPGYMMCLDRGGTCEGVVLRLPAEGIVDVMEKLLRREISRKSALEAVRWIDVETEDGPLQALAFYAAPAHLDSYVQDRPLDEVAQGLARACGHWGSGAEYLYNTVLHLEQLGIHDDGLWTLQEKVAHEIEALYGFATVP
ncbi:gamma-glutamylcyclotransferase [Aestuariivirga sp.]|uniref:gamma-glutamylcyclotransferase n=1 Tax=Aestuariivirga sp. TaxID=2650926 RepID=UPI0039E5DC1D